MMITIAFLVISALILWFIIGSKGQWGIKAATISLALYFCLSIGLSLENLAGWPSGQELPEKFEVHWIVIKEPNKKTGEKGAVYIWARDIEPQEKDGWWLQFSSNDRDEPRVYQVPYSRELHEQSEGAMEKIKAGGKVGGKKGDGKGKGEGEGDGDGEGGKKGQNGNNGGGSLSGFSGIIFHELPPSKLPEK
jgi:hypothetical protein